MSAIVSGVVAGIALHRELEGAMEGISEAFVTYESGIEGDIRGSGGHNRKRQVTVLFWENWLQACREIGEDIYWFARRANVLITPFSSISPGPWMIGWYIVFDSSEGTGAVLEITGELKPCRRMDEVYPGLQEFLAKDWRGGVTCRVKREGKIRYASTFRLVELLS